MLKMKGMRFPKEIILVCIRWYAAYALSYRNSNYSGASTKGCVVQAKRG